MKYIILISAILLVGGCEEGRTKAEEEERRRGGQEAYRRNLELTPEEQKVVGTYEHKLDSGDTIGIVLLEKRIVENYMNGDKLPPCKPPPPLPRRWRILDKEIYIYKQETGRADEYFKINPDGSITSIAYVAERKRIDRPKEEQRTYTKIK